MFFGFLRVMHTFPFRQVRDHAIYVSELYHYNLDEDLVPGLTKFNESVKNLEFLK